MVIFELIIVFLIALSIGPIINTGIWFFKTRKLGYSWNETWDIETYNCDISTQKRNLYMMGYYMEDIYKVLPKEKVYTKK